MQHYKKTLVILSPGFPKDEADTTCLPSQQIFVRSLNKIFPALKIIILNGEKKSFIGWIGLWRILDEIKKENNLIGLFSFWCGECALIGKYFGKRNNLKHFTWITGQDARKGNKYIKLIRPRSYELIAMSDFLAKEFYKNYHVHPLHIIPNGIDESLFLKQTTKRNITILGAGSLIPLKQYDVFINALKEITGKIPDVIAMLCGKGPQETELQKLIVQQQLQNNIVLTGEVSHKEILRLMQQTKIFLHTSNYEGFSTVCLEALYAGCHVISFIKPMHYDIDHWHIVQTKEEMINKAIELLKNSGTTYTAVMPYAMDDSAKAVIQLFNYKETATF